MKYEKTGEALTEAEVFKLLSDGNKIIDFKGTLCFIKKSSVFCDSQDGGAAYKFYIDTYTDNYYRAKEVEEEEIKLTEEMLNGWWKHKSTGLYTKFSCPFNAGGVITIDVVTYNSLNHFLMHWVAVEAKEVIEAMKRVRE